MSLWTPIENPGTRPPRPGLSTSGAPCSPPWRRSGPSFAQTAHPSLAVGLVVAVVTAFVLPLRRGLARPGIRRARQDSNQRPAA